MDSADVKKEESDPDYWKNLANEYMQKFEQEREEFLEFQSNSRELEVELEGQLESLEKENKLLKFKNSQILDEFNQYKNNVESRMNEFKLHGDSQDTVIAQKTEEIENLNKRIRYLEQQNDDLERAYRNATVSLEDFEAKLNSELEKNAMLENELDEKENLHVIIQRLKDETRDLQQELVARQKKNKAELSNTTPTSPQEPVKTPPKKDTTPETPPKKKPVGLALSPNAKMLLTQKTMPVDSVPGLNPSVKFAALNMITELLDKMSNIERKMGSLYNFYGSQFDENVLANP